MAFCSYLIKDRIVSLTRGLALNSYKFPGKFDGPHKFDGIFLRVQVIHVFLIHYLSPVFIISNEEVMVGLTHIIP